jgi:stearoyl-CoA desaturase (delta-9 desaturase)
MSVPVRTKTYFDRVTSATRESIARTYFHLGTVPFWLIHVAAILGVVWIGFSWTGVLLAISAYFVRMLFVTAGYHRYFSHRSFKTSRWFQFALAFIAQSGAQRSIFWWAAQHRKHHRYTDTERDPHSSRRGFWWSHMGWMLSRTTNPLDRHEIRDLAKFPELRLLHRLNHVPALVLALAFLALGGIHALVWGFFVSTVLLWHGTFTINSLAHRMGRRRYATADDSRNSWILAILTLGEGWHNNHHHYMGSASQGFFWWEIDITTYVLRGLERLGLVHRLHRAPEHIRAAVSSKVLSQNTASP